MRNWASDRRRSQLFSATSSGQRGGIGQAKIVMTIMLCVASGCTFWESDYPSRAESTPVIFDANRNRVIAQCRTHADTSAMVNPGKRDSDGSYAAPYETCLDGRGY